MADDDLVRKKAAMSIGVETEVRLETPGNPEYGNANLYRTPLAAPRLICSGDKFKDLA
jgi:hypothetical protein